MPELPEVEHARKLVHAHCVNKICTNVIFPSAETGVLDEKCFKDIGEEMFKKAVLNKRLLNTHRKGKQGWRVGRFVPLRDDRGVLGERRTAVKVRGV
jgi:formamidopyrimidine-DNA glycosylase